MISLEKLAQKKLDQILIDVGYVKQDKLEEAYQEVKKDGTRTLQQVLLDNKTIDEFALAHALCRELQLPFLSFENYTHSEEVIQKFPKNLMIKYHCVPVDEFPNIITVVVSDIITTEMLQDIFKHTQKKALVYIGLRSEINNILNQYITEEEKSIIHTQAIIPEKQQVTAGWESIFDAADSQVMAEVRKKGDYLKTPEIDSMMNISGLSISQNNQLQSQVLVSNEVLQNNPQRQQYSKTQDFSYSSSENVQIGYSDVGEESEIRNIQQPPDDVSQNDSALHSDAILQNEVISQNEEVEQESDEESLRLELEKLAVFLKKDPFNYDAVNRYVEVAVTLGNMQAAIAQLLLFAKGLHQAGDIPGAVNCYRYIQELAPNNLPARQYLAQYASRLP